MEVVALTGMGTMVGTQILSFDAAGGTAALLLLLAVSAVGILSSRGVTTRLARRLGPALRLHPAPACGQ